MEKIKKPTKRVNRVPYNFMYEMITLGELIRVKKHLEQKEYGKIQAMVDEWILKYQAEFAFVVNVDEFMVDV